MTCAGAFAPGAAVLLLLRVISELLLCAAAFQLAWHARELQSSHALHLAWLGQLPAAG